MLDLCRVVTRKTNKNRELLLQVTENRDSHFPYWCLRLGLPRRELMGVRILWP